MVEEAVDEMKVGKCWTRQDAVIKSTSRKSICPTSLLTQQTETEKTLVDLTANGNRLQLHQDCQLRNSTLKDIGRRTF
jgi:hypothetical protein